jgi:hypothetical protein
VSTSESGNGLQDFLLSLSFRCLCDEPTQHGRRITHPECPVHEKQAFKDLLGAVAEADAALASAFDALTDTSVMGLVSHAIARLRDPSLGERP